VFVSSSKNEHIIKLEKINRSENGTNKGLKSNLLERNIILIMWALSRYVRGAVQRNCCVQIIDNDLCSR
ncbi:MAG: hypothetical protein ACI90V_010136, partial [Bacillariaceae sp.]|jgi:hypothetical protein